MDFNEMLQNVTTPESRRKLELTEYDYTLAANAVQGELERQNTALVSARAAAKEILSQLCVSPDVSTSDRAAWSAAYHDKSWGTPDGFMQKAEEYKTELDKVSALLVPNAPIIGFITGPVADHNNPSPHAMRYTYRVSDGSGLTLAERFNTGQLHFYHQATAAEQPLHPEANVLDMHKDSKAPLISDMDLNSLVGTIYTPEEAGSLLRTTPRDATRIYVIGSRAVNAMFEVAGSNPRSDALLGHAVHLGFRPEF